MTGRSLWLDEREACLVNRLIYFQVDLFVGAPVDELKGHCAGYAEKEEIN